MAGGDSVSGADRLSALQLQLRLHAMLTRAIASGADSLADVLAPCARAIGTALRVESLGVWTLGPDGAELLLQSAYREDGGTQPLAVVRIGRAHADALSSAAHPPLFHDPRFEEPLFSPPLSGPERRVAACALVVRDGRLIGVLAVSRQEPLTQGEDELFASVADLITVAVDRQHAAERLREREDGLGTLISTAPDGILLMNGRSRILAVNPSLEQIFGYQPGELVGEDVTILMPERFRSQHNTGVRRYRETGQKRISWHGIDLVGLRKDGSEFPIEISFGEYVHNGEMVFTGFVRDVTQRTRTRLREERRRRSVQRTAVYVGSSLVALQAADLLLPVLPLPAWTFNALVLTALLGLPVVVGAAWRRGEGKLPAAHVQAARRGTLSRARVLSWIGMAALLLTVLAGGMIAADPGARTAPAAHVVAVLPFESMDESAVTREIAAGISEDVVAELAAVEELRVVSRTSVLALAGPGRTVAGLARELDADHVVEGSVRRAGDRIRVTVRLVRAGRDRHVWAQSYERQVGDAFSAQSELAAAIASAVGRSLRP
jgi:PAS domain S-box-containing protein